MSSLIRVLTPAVVVVVLACTPAAALAQINCGTTSVSHSMRQTPRYLLSVDVTAITSRTINTCPMQVQTEAWVDALATGYVSIATDAYSASVSFTRPVPYYGTWHSTARHWLIWFITGSWQNLGNTYAQVNVVSGSVYSCPLTDSSCSDGYAFKPSLCACVFYSPILVDTAGDGYRLTAAGDGVVFDLDANGIAAEQIAWTEPGSDDGWLVMDRNGNGRIDSGEELFGSRTPAYADAAEPRTENGFDALLLLEGPSYGPAHVDRIIDAHDAAYSRLRVWVDRNHNAVSEADELVSLADAGILAISTEYTEEARRDQFGNKFSLRGKILVRGPQGQETWRNIYDAYLTVAGPPTR